MDVTTLRELIIEDAKAAFQAKHDDYPIIDQHGQAFLIVLGTVTPAPVGPLDLYAAITYRERPLSILKVFLKGPNRQTTEEAIKPLFNTSTEAIQAVVGQQIHSGQGRATHNGGMMME